MAKSQPGAAAMNSPTLAKARTLMQKHGMSWQNALRVATGGKARGRPKGSKGAKKKASAASAEKSVKRASRLVGCGTTKLGDGLYEAGSDYLAVTPEGKAHTFKKG